MKITKYLVSMAAALGMIAGCYKPEMIQVSSPEDVIAPVLEAVEGPIEITAENMANGSVEFKWSLADYGVKTEVSYAIEVANASAKATVTSGITADTTAMKANELSTKVAYEALNQILFNDLKLADGVAEEVSFTVVASVGELPKVYSNTVKVYVKVTAAEKVYPMIYMPGSYQGWDPAGAATKFQVLYDFAGNGVFEGIADFGQANDEGRAWKFTREPNWDFDWGIPEGETPDAEAAEVTLHNNDNGGRSDIKIYTVNRYYHFSMDTNTGLLKKNFAFDQIGVIGSFNSWGGDVVMEYNAAKKRFYADVEFAEDGQFKLRANADWAMNWGADAFGVSVSNGDGNLEAKAGNYRVYAYMSNPAEMTIELVAGMYGKEEVAGGSTTPEPEPEPAFQGWALIGGFNEWGADLALTSDGTYYVVKGVELEGELKFRKDADWGVNLGLAEGAEFAANAEIALAANGGNINVAAATYDVYLDDVNSKAWFITDGSYPGGGEAPVEAEWGLIGSLAACNNWSNNVKLYVSGDYSVAKGVEFSAGDQFKFRKGEAWGVELTYEGAITIDAKLDLIDGTGGKQNSSISEAGTYDVYLANDLSAFYVMTPGKTPADAGEAQKVYINPADPSFVVGFSGSAIGWDDPSYEANDRAGYVKYIEKTNEATHAGTYMFKLDNFTVAVGDEFKVRINGQWIGAGEGGATVEGLAVSGGDNFIADEAGTYCALITFVWDGQAHSDVKVVFEGGAAPADPWTAKFANGEDATDDALMKEIAAYADATNLYVRVTAVAALEGANYLDVNFCDGNGTESVWWGWTTTGTNKCWNEHKGSVDAEGNLTSMDFEGNAIAVKTEKTADSVVWYLTYPRESVSKYVAAGKIYVSALLWNNWGPYFAVPARGNAMLEVTLP